MIRHYVLIAWRQIVKNKLYAAINVLGLAVGLTVYLFGTLLVAYEESHDAFYENADRVYTAGSIASPTADMGIAEIDSTYSAFAPFFLAEVEGVEAVARVVKSDFLLSVDDNHYHQQIRFTDPSLLEIFDFKYLEGNERALEDPSGILLTRSSATKFFGPDPALGKVLTLNHDTSLHVAAVIEDLPPNTHFNSALISIMGAGFEVVAPLTALNRITGYNLEGNWGNLNLGDLTYLLVPEGRSREWLQLQLDGIFERHFPAYDTDRAMISGLRARPLIEANTAIWQSIGMPVLDTVALLAFLVLVVAIANYTNLATAQSLGRSREIGLRKTMGAARRQLVVQFMVESLCITLISMLLALAFLEVLVPVYNGSVGRELVLDYTTTLPWLVTTTVLVGITAGAYPAYLITRASPIEALGGTRTMKGSHFRSTMLGMQFAISIFMLAMVFIIYLQNQKIENASNIYPKSQIITLQRLGLESIQKRFDTLRNELLSLPDVQNVSFASQLPYQQSNSTLSVAPVEGDESGSFMINQISVDEHFLSTYDIPLLAGRNFSREVARDTHTDGVPELNVIMNELALSKLGFSSPEDALNQVIYEFSDRTYPRSFTIIGVMPDQNFQGFHNTIKPTVFQVRPGYAEYGSIRVAGGAMDTVLTDIETVWKQQIPDYPIKMEFLEDMFRQIYQIFRAMAVFVGGFAFVALALSLIGLFGLSAFAAASRTKEIGIRKVMGANMLQIVRLLVWQFSRPALWALLFAMPLAYFASEIYLNFFADRISMLPGVVATAGVSAVLFAWSIVAVHAIRIARVNPVEALRYE